MKLKAYAYGPNAILYRSDEEPNRALSIGLEILAERLRKFPQVLEARISYCELLLVLSSNANHEQIQALVGDLLLESSAANEVQVPTRLHKIWVSYTGPDLEDVAEQTGLRFQEIKKLHTGQKYTVHALGFQPGFAFLGTLPAPIQVPRRSVPRIRVPANCIAIAADQTAIYPHESPGGWHIIGFTKREVFDVDSDSLSIFQVGDTVQFSDVDEL